MERGDVKALKKIKEEENEKKSNESSKKELTDDEFDNKLDKAIDNKFDKGGQKINPMDVALAYNTDHPETVTINNEVDEDDDWDPATADLDNIDPDKLSKKQVEKMLVYLNSLDAEDEDEETDEGVDDIDEFNKSVEESMRQHIESENESDNKDSEDDDLDEESEDGEEYEDYVPDPDDPSLVGFDPSTIDYSRCRPSDFTPAQLWVIEQYMMQSEDEPEEDEE